MGTEGAGGDLFVVVVVVAAILGTLIGVGGVPPLLDEPIACAIDNLVGVGGTLLATLLTFKSAWPITDGRRGRAIIVNDPGCAAAPTPIEARLKAN